MSLNSFSSEDKIRAGIVRPKPWKNVGLIERPDHYHKAFRGVGMDKIYWSIGEVCQMLAVSAPTVRFWMQEFGVEVKRSGGGKNMRLFTADDVEKMKHIHKLLKEDLYTIEGVKKQLRNANLVGKTL